MLDKSLKVLDFLKHESDVKLIYSLFSGFINLLAILPRNLFTGQCFNPIIDLILQIKQKCKVFLFNLFPVLIIIKSTFSSHQFISVFVKGHHKEGQERDDDAEKPSRIRKDLIQFTNISGN